MCGITGWVDWDRDLHSRRRTVEAMTATMACRGPHSAGVWMSSRAALGHRRLAVMGSYGPGRLLRVTRSATTESRYWQLRSARPFEACWRTPWTASSSATCRCAPCCPGGVDSSALTVRDRSVTSFSLLLDRKDRISMLVGLEVRFAVLRPPARRVSVGRPLGAQDRRRHRERPAPPSGGRPAPDQGRVAPKERLPGQPGHCLRRRHAGPHG